MQWKVIWAIIALIGLALIILPFLVTDYAFKHLGDNGAAMLWFYPPWALLLHGSFWGGLAITFIGLIRFGTTSK